MSNNNSYYHSEDEFDKVLSSLRAVKEEYYNMPPNQAGMSDHLYGVASSLGSVIASLQSLQNDITESAKSWNLSAAFGGRRGRKANRSSKTRKLRR